MRTLALGDVGGVCTNSKSAQFGQITSTSTAIVHNYQVPVGIKWRFSQSLSTVAITVIAQYVDVSHVTQIHIVGQAVVVHSYTQNHKTYTHYYLQKSSKLQYASQLPHTIGKWIEAQPQRQWKWVCDVGELLPRCDSWMQYRLGSNRQAKPSLLPHRERLMRFASAMSHEKRSDTSLRSEQ